MAKRAALAAGLVNHGSNLKEVPDGDRGALADLSFVFTGLAVSRVTVIDLEKRFGG